MYIHNATHAFHVRYSCWPGYQLRTGFTRYSELAGRYATAISEETSEQVAKKTTHLLRLATNKLIAKESRQQARTSCLSCHAANGIGKTSQHSVKAFAERVKQKVSQRVLNIASSFLCVFSQRLKRISRLLLNISVKTTNGIH